MPPRLLLYIALGVATVGALVSLWGTFVLDDPVAVQQSACVTGSLDLARIFGSNFWCEPGPLWSIQSWRPLPVLAWWFLYLLGGSAIPFHVLNIALHLACTALTYSCGRRLGMDERAAGLGAVIFASLAIHVDAVALVVGGAELWAALFILLAVHAVASGRIIFPLWCGLAMLSKETGVLAFALVATIAVLRDRKRPTLIAVGVAALVTFGVLFARASVLGAWTGTHIPAFVNPLVDAGIADRVSAGVAIIGRYHRVLLTANPLSADYAHAAIGVGDATPVLDVALGITAIGAWAVLFFRPRPAGVLALWVLGGCLFVSNIVFVLPAMFAERLFYVPSVAVALMLGWGAAVAPDRLGVRPRIIAVGLGAFVAFQTAVSMLHTWRYGDELRIIEATVDATPNNARARMWLAQRRLDAGDLDGTREHARAAAAVRPHWGRPHAFFAVAHDLDGDPEAALASFREAMRKDAADPEVTNLFIQFLLRYDKRSHADLVYQAHSEARGSPHPDVTPP